MIIIQIPCISSVFTWKFLQIFDFKHNLRISFLYKVMKIWIWLIIHFDLYLYIYLTYIELLYLNLKIISQ